METLLVRHDEAPLFPCLAKSLKTCANFATAVFKKEDSNALRTTARYQWVFEAYTVLLPRFCIAERKSQSPSRFLATSPSQAVEDGFLTDMRHHGYVILGLTVELWEMRVKVVHDLKERHENNSEKNHFTFHVHA